MEVTPDGKRLLDAGAILGTREWHSAKLNELEPWLPDASILAGHNLVRHDLPILLSRFGKDALSDKLFLDTLGWSALLYADKPYHKLVKGYQLHDEDAESNPLSDAKLCRRLLEEMLGQFAGLDTGLKRAYWGLLHDKQGYGPFFRISGYTPLDLNEPPGKSIEERFSGHYCMQADVATMAREHPIELAHALALIATVQDASVLPPWVVHAFLLLKTCCIIYGSPLWQFAVYLLHRTPRSPQSATGPLQLLRFPSFRG
ncbi:MAG: hypothetical protein LC114_14430 [Bryobacterales bacterium]|nr:hypothetical protein [Bryobacterales bacterium]